MVALMREILLEQIADPGSTQQVARLTVGRLEAQGVADSFFAMCRTRLPLKTKAEQAIEGCLRDQVNQEVRRRNRIAHGDWLIYGWAEASAVPSEAKATFVRVQTSDVKKPFQYEDLTASQIDAYAYAVESLERLICDFGCICTEQGAYASEGPGSGLGITDVFEITDAAEIDTDYPSKRCLRYREGMTSTYWPHEPFVPSSANPDSPASASS